ncbi:MAG: HemK/PrmC family methyltransferase [Planctomycetota bacterium]
MIFNYKEFLQKYTPYLQNLYSKRDATEIVNHLIFFYLSDKEDGELKLLPKNVKKNNLNKFLKALRNIREGLPIQYVVKTVKFYGRDFYIEKGVFIPRLDTEFLVDLVLGKVRDRRERLNFLDIGVGSGAPTITILLEKPNTYATGIDISKKALKISFINGYKYNVLNRLEIIYSDVFEQLGERYYNKFDFIISNPPYVPCSKYRTLHESIFYEPKEAIVGGKDGNKIIEKILAGYKQYLKEKGFLAFEFPPYNLEEIRKIFREKKIVNFKFYNENNTGFAIIENGG